MAQTSTATKSKAGLGLTIASVVILAVPLLYILYGTVSTVTLNSSDEVTRLFTVGLVLTAVAGLLGLVATILHGMGLGKGFTTGKGVNTGISVVVLLASAALLFTTVLPRANAVQKLNNTLVPFGYAIRDNCQTPLDTIQADFKKTKADADNNATDDAAFATAIKADITKIQTDSSALSNGLNKLNSLTVPDSKYQKLLDGCKKDVKGEIDLLTSSSAIPLPEAAQAAAGASSVSLTTLLQDAATVAGAGITFPGLPAHPAQLLTSQVMAQVVAASDPELTAAGDEFKADINNTLKDNLAPFKAGPSLQA
jgi:hypothetical protein